MKTGDVSILDTALSYAKRGWCVMPLHEVTHGHCSCDKGDACGKNAGKHPRIDKWTEQASIDPAQIRPWWQQWPYANVGILTGERSHLAVLDIDPRNGGDVALNDLQQCYRALPDTPMVLTGGKGLHYYFRLDSPLASCHPAHGIDLQADGVQVVAPPSLHMSGAHYEWEASSEPDDIPLAPLPDWLQALAQDHADAKAADVALPEVLPEVALTKLQVSNRIKYIIRTGEAPKISGCFASRSEALFAVETAMIGAGYDAGTIASVIMNKDYPISAKVWSQKNPKSPLYVSQTRQWVAGDIGRARAWVATHPLDHETPDPPPVEEDAREIEDLLLYASAHGVQHRNGTTPGPEPTDLSACPELPDYARINEASADDASSFLDDYIVLSKKWAPRAYEGFHEAVALFLLSTIAARRIKLLFGPRGVYTSLYIALAARTTVYTKSTTADIGLALLDAAGLSWLLADDDSTPQAFLRSLTRYIPSNYADLPPDEQEHTQRQLAFSAQRGWFYEEWGQHLESMMQKNGYMASFRSILRRMDDHKERYVSNTIARGRDILSKPYISLLANVTPSDLQPFVKAHSQLWRDGYIARFAFVSPDQTEGSEAEFPEGHLTFPGYMVSTLKAGINASVCLPAF